jgi:anti-sigma B factor antagonist
VQWVGRQATVALPEHIDVYNAGPIRDALLAVINRGAQTLIVDMSATISCDHAGADAVVRASQRAALGGTRLRLVVTDRIVSRVLSLSGLDRLVSIYPSLEAAMAASRAPAAVPALVPAAGGQRTDQRERLHLAGRRRAEVPAASRPDANGAIISTAAISTAAISTAAVRELVNALQDGIALTGDDGTITLASRRLEEMFGYEHAELPGQLVESLMPAGQPAGRRKDGTTFPAEISLNPVTTAGGRFTMIVIRDITAALRLNDLADEARAAVTAEREQLFDSVTASLSHAALSLQAAMAQAADAAREHLTAAVGYLDETIREVRETAFTTRGHERPPDALRA